MARSVRNNKTEDGTPESVPMPIEKLALTRVLPEVARRVKKILTRTSTGAATQSAALQG